MLPLPESALCCVQSASKAAQLDKLVDFAHGKATKILGQLYAYRIQRQEKAPVLELTLYCVVCRAPARPRSRMS